MEVGSASSATAMQAVLAALAEAAGGAEPGAEAAEPALPGGLGALLQDAGAGHAHAEAVPGVAAALTDQQVQTADAAPHREAHPLGHGPEAATLQANTPARSSANDVPAAPAGAPAVADAPFTSAGSAPLAAEPLLAGTVIGLQVEPGWAFGLQRRGFEPSITEAPLPHRADARGGHPQHDQDEAEPEPEADDAEAVAAAPQPAGRDARGLKEEAWAAPLSRALREALASPSPPAALSAAAEQWRLGRCVVLACPQGADPTGPAWAFVLWPRAGARSAERLALFGLRVDARLSWQRLPPSVDWCHTRVVKTHHPRQGRQLAAVDGDAAQPVACELQLGPVRPIAPRWREACVRVDAVRRFWAALGEQWSVTVVVRSRPVAAGRTPPLNETARESAC